MSTPESAHPAAAPKRSLQICIASPDFTGLSAHGGTGLAYTAMAHALAAAGHKVTCLFLGARETSPADLEHWVEKYRADGLTLVALPPINASDLVAPLHLTKSYETFQWLKRNDRFDIIHFPDQRGPGYHTVTAKRHGLGFARATICVGLHNMTAWLKGESAECPDLTADAETSFMERQALALADAVVSPSHYMLNQVTGQHWEMPARRYVQQNMLPSCAAEAQPPVAPGLREVRELVFFGALETRNGITMFCDALDALPASITENLEVVTFLGRESMIDGGPAWNYAQRRAQRWPFKIQIMADLEEDRALDYLRHKSRLAVIPSIVDNSSDRVVACLDAGIAFVASRVGSVPELITPSDVCRVCFDPKPGSLCLLLCSALTEGLRPARAALDAGANRQAWIALHENSLYNAALPAQPPRHLAPAGPPPETADEETEIVRMAVQALSIDLKDVIALKTLARVHLNAGLWEAAEEVCRIILKRRPKDTEALQMMDEARVQEAKLMENIIDSNPSAASAPDQTVTASAWTETPA
jgi:hypothetical protein